jgi:hypothetical protein
MTRVAREWKNGGKRPAGDVEGRYYRGKVRATQITLFEASCVPPGGEGLPMLQGVVGAALVSLERKDHRIIGAHEAYTEVDAVIGAQTVIAAIAFGRR